MRITGGLASITIAATSVTLFTKGTTVVKNTILRKIMWYNPGANSLLLIGYTTLGGVFAQVLPDILMLTGVHDGISELDLPICGNSPTGFRPDTTPATGTLGDIIGRASVAGVAPNNIRVQVEVDEE